jgi:hypothetical protein
MFAGAEIDGGPLLREIESLGATFRFVSSRGNIPMPGSGRLP